MSAEDQKASEKAKARGNKAFEKRDYAQAVSCFGEAIGLTPDNKELYSNRAAAYTKLEQWEEAVADANTCIKLDPSWGKGYSRLGMALYTKGDYALAVAAYAQGLAHDPSNESLTSGLQAAQKKLQPKKKTGKKGRQQKKEADKERAEKEEADRKVHNAGLETVIGIDLGTTYSCVGVWEGDAVKIIPNAHGSKTTPSYVSWGPNGERLVGQQAKAMATQLPKSTIFDVKRIIGQRWTDSGVLNDIQSFPFDMEKGEDDKPMIVVSMDGKRTLYAPEEISAMVLADLKLTAENYLQRPVHKAVVTVPAYFNDAQRSATKTAGQIAGLEVLRIINEPTAAALAYGLDNVSKESGEATNVCIFDLGGGTFDVSILSIEAGIFTVKATGGDIHLGGEDFDNTMQDFVLAEAAKAGFTDLKQNQNAVRRVRNAVEKAKRELSQGQETEIVLENFAGEKSFSMTLTRKQFENCNKGAFALCMEVVKRVLKDAKMKQTDIHQVVLVGGSTRIPKLQENLKEYFGGRDLCKALNPDEAVAYGAAVQAAILSGQRHKKTDDVLLMDVTPLSLGIETTGKVMSVIIPRNTSIPCVRTQTYTTEQNYQTKVDISVYEGERLNTDANHLLGEFTISGIERAKRGEPQVEVTFAIDSNGILDVKARDKTTGAEAKIQIAKQQKTSDEEIKRMVAEAERFKKQDQMRARRLEAKHELENLILTAMEEADAIQKKNPKLANILRAAAEKEQEFLDTLDSGDEVNFAEIKKHVRALERRVRADR
eukprot:g41752.t1